jgi:hypothetical protein
MALPIYFRDRLEDETVMVSWSQIQVKCHVSWYAVVLGEQWLKPLTDKFACEKNNLLCWADSFGIKETQVPAVQLFA